MASESWWINEDISDSCEVCDATRLFSDEDSPDSTSLLLLPLLAPREMVEARLEYDVSLESTCDSRVRALRRRDSHALGPTAEDEEDVDGYELAICCVVSAMTINRCSSHAVQCRPLSRGRAACRPSSIVLQRGRDARVDMLNLRVNCKRTDINTVTHVCGIHMTDDCCNRRTFIKLQKTSPVISCSSGCRYIPQRSTTIQSP